MPTYVLGLNAHHGEASACLMKDGEIVGAVEEERFTRVKYTAALVEAGRRAVEREYTWHAAAEAPERAYGEVIAPNRSRYSNLISFDPHTGSKRRRQDG